LVSANSFSQEYKEYYVVEKTLNTLSYQSKSLNIDGSLALTFQDNAYQNHLASKKIYKYEKAFKGTFSSLLERIYYVILGDSENLNDLNNIAAVDFFAEIPDEELLEHPDDFETDGLYPGTQATALDLVKAPFAWQITKGDDPNVMIGIVDHPFNIDHEDLADNIFQNEGSTTTNPSHGTRVAGYASAVTDNGIGVASIGYNTKLVVSSLPMIANTIDVWHTAQIPGVRVINTAWVSTCKDDHNMFEVYREIYREVWEDFGVIVVSAAGNGNVWDPSTCGLASSALIYPAAYEHTISVSSVGSTFPRGYMLTDSQGNEYGRLWEDVHVRFLDQPGRTHQHNDKVDLVAPGYNVPGNIDHSDGYYTIGTGTSYASPQVSAAAALVLSVDPLLTPDEVKDILVSTTDDIYWIPQNQPYIGLLGSGRLNVFRAVKKAQCMISEDEPTLDLMIGDSKKDLGIEPNTETPRMWESSDIWIRNQDDGKLYTIHQNPTYQNGNGLNYVYVRVRNLGCKTSSGAETVSLNWAKANTALAWPEHWDGSLTVEGVTMGGEIGDITIPSLEPGEETVIEIPWNVPNPDDYTGINDNPWHFCLIAKINAIDDPLTSPETSNPNIMVRNNNNLAWKNVSIIEVDPNDIAEENLKEKITVAVGVTNPFNSQKKYEFEFLAETNESGKTIYDEADIAIEMDSVFYSAWSAGGSQTTSLTNYAVDKKQLVTANNAILGDVELEAQAYATLNLTFNFLVKELTDKRHFKYHLIQKDASTGEVVGGETFLINKKNRETFTAIAQQKTSQAVNTNVILSANQLFEAAIYNWYDSEGNLIYTGQNFEITPEITKTYKLEVIAQKDGFKDYSEIEVEGIPFEIRSLSPNPANQSVLVNYYVASNSSSYLIVTDLSNAQSNNYILNPNASELTIDLSAYQAGTYSITLVSDGNIIESKNLIKN
jgi:subtilisin family serine protease